MDLAGTRCLVLGAGGAARAVVCALDLLGASEVAVAARRAERAQRLVASPAQTRVRALGWEDAEARAAEFDLVVNATPVGMQHEDLLDRAELSEGQAVVDLIYNPPITPLVERARARGAVAWGGLGMLVHQAAASLRIWSGQEPPIEAMSVAAMHALSRH